MEDETMFDIITPSRIYTILCSSTQDRADWIRQINYAKTNVVSSFIFIFLF